MLQKTSGLDELADIADMATHGLLESEGGSIFGGKLAHLGYGAGLLKLHDYLKRRYNRKLLGELAKVVQKHKVKI